MADSRPTLWHIPVSHYSEKARWALAYKGIEHRRVAPPAGVHVPVALALTRGRTSTFPILRLDGSSVGDSTAIIAALERRNPDPPLYPEDPEERRRALELEEFFDEELGPHARLFVFNEIREDPDGFAEVAAMDLPAPLRRFKRQAGATARAYTQLRFGAGDPEAAEVARRKVFAGLDRLEEELGSNEYLAGGRFSVADLTAAALLYPIVLPPEGPKTPERQPPGLERFRKAIADRDAYRWVEEMFARHRRR